MTAIKSVVDQHKFSLDDFIDQRKLNFLLVVDLLEIDQHWAFIEDAAKDFTLLLPANLDKLEHTHNLRYFFEQELVGLVLPFVLISRKLNNFLGFGLMTSRLCLDQL